MKIQALIYDGFDELDIIGAFEPLRMAGESIRLVSLYEQEIVEAAHGLKVIPDGTFNLVDPPELLLVPGGGWISRRAKGAWTEYKKGFVLDQLRLCHEAGAILAAVCTGTLLVGHAGLLKGRQATTNKQTIDELKATGANYVATRVVDDGNIITASGITSSIDLGLWIVERLMGEARAAAIATALEYY